LPDDHPLAVSDIIYWTDLPAVRKRLGMELIDALARRGGQADVQARLVVGPNRTSRCHDPERRMMAAIAECALALVQAAVAERRQGRIIEPFRTLDIAHADGNMVKHGHRSFGSPQGFRKLRHRCRGTAPGVSGFDTARAELRLELP